MVRYLELDRGKEVFGNRCFESWLEEGLGNERLERSLEYLRYNFYCFLASRGKYGTICNDVIR